MCRNVYEFVIGPPESFYFVALRVTATSESRYKDTFCYSLEIALWPYEYVRMEGFRRKILGEPSLVTAAIFISELHRDLVSKYLGRNFTPYWDAIRWHVREDFSLY